MDAGRRAGLRKLAYARIDAHRKAGPQLIESWTADRLMALVSGSLTTDDAKTFLDSLPSGETLLPFVRVTPEMYVERVDVV
jgi:hypothetical protein